MLRPTIEFYIECESNKCTITRNALTWKARASICLRASVTHLTRQMPVL